VTDQRSLNKHECSYPRYKNRVYGNSRTDKFLCTSTTKYEVSEAQQASGGRNFEFAFIDLVLLKGPVQPEVMLWCQLMPKEDRGQAEFKNLGTLDRSLFQGANFLIRVKD
jgi:hypothetical protein